MQLLFILSRFQLVPFSTGCLVFGLPPWDIMYQDRPRVPFSLNGSMEMHPALWDPPPTFLPHSAPLRRCPDARILEYPTKGAIKMPSYGQYFASLWNPSSSMQYMSCSKHFNTVLCP